MAKRYRVLSDTSTRASADPASPDYDRWIFHAAGDVVTSWPDHLPVDELVASGHWEPVVSPKREEAA